MTSAAAFALLSSSLKTPVAYGTTLPHDDHAEDRRDHRVAQRAPCAERPSPLLLPQELLPGELPPPLILLTTGFSPHASRTSVGTRASCEPTACVCPVPYMGSLWNRQRR